MFGFGGQLKDDEFKGAGNSLNYTFRMYDSRLARFFAVDPIDSEYPELTPYQFASNSPIINIDLEGLEGGNSNSVSTNNYFGFKITITTSWNESIFNKIQLTGGFKQDFSKIKSLTNSGTAGTFGITPKLEIKSTVDILPKFNILAYTKLEVSTGTTGTFSGKFELGQDYSKLTLSHPVGVKQHENKLKEVKTGTITPPAINMLFKDENADKIKSIMNTSLSLGEHILPKKVNPPIALQFGFKPDPPVYFGYKPTYTLNNNFSLGSLSIGQNIGSGNSNESNSPNNSDNNGIQIGPLMEDGTF